MKLTKANIVAEMGACEEGCRWVQRQGRLPMRLVYERCRQPGWLIWLLSRLGLYERMTVERFAHHLDQDVKFSANHASLGRIRRKMCDIIRGAYPWSKIKMYYISEIRRISRIPKLNQCRQCGGPPSMTHKRRVTDNGWMVQIKCKLCNYNVAEYQDTLIGARLEAAHSWNRR